MWLWILISEMNEKIEGLHFVVCIQCTRPCMHSSVVVLCALYTGTLSSCGSCSVRPWVPLPASGGALIFVLAHPDNRWLWRTEDLSNSDKWLWRTEDLAHPDKWLCDAQRIWTTLTSDCDALRFWPILTSDCDTHRFCRTTLWLEHFSKNASPFYFIPLQCLLSIDQVTGDTSLCSRQSRWSIRINSWRRIFHRCVHCSWFVLWRLTRILISLTYPAQYCNTQECLPWW